MTATRRPFCAGIPAGKSRWLENSQSQIHHSPYQYDRDAAMVLRVGFGKFHKIYRQAVTITPRARGQPYGG